MMKYPKKSGLLPITKSRAVSSNGVSGLISMTILKNPSFGITYTTGVKYITKDKPILMNLPISLYSNPIGVIIRPTVTPNKIIRRIARGKKNNDQ